MRAYRILRSILRFVAGVFFRQVEVAGLENLPVDGDGEGDGPLIFAGNHPNSLMDPVLIIVTCGRIVHFAARDALFKGKLMRPILLALGAVPVARRSDHAGPVDNSAMFDQLAQVLIEGRAMGIFPEGLSHDESQLQKLKTGAARIALDVASRGVLQKPVKIVPCGLNYVRRKRFRSRVLVQYGQPIVIDEARLAAFRSDERAAVRELTDEVDRGIRGLTVNASDWKTLRVLDAVRRLYQPAGISLEDRTELSRRFNDVYPSVAEQPEARAVYHRVEEYLDRLQAAGLSDRDISRGLGTRATVRRALRQILLGVLWLPLAAPGIVLHAPLAMLISFSGPLLAPRKDVMATTKLVLGLILLPLAWGAVLVAVAHHFGALVALAALLVLVLSGFAALRVLERGVRLGKLLAASARAFGVRRELAALRAERSALEADVQRAVEHFLPAGMTPLFPRAHGEP